MCLNAKLQRWSHCCTVKLVGVTVLTADLLEINQHSKSIKKEQIAKNMNVSYTVPIINDTNTCVYILKLKYDTFIY